MKVCDKCEKRAYTTIEVPQEGAQIDLCEVHYSDFMKWTKEKPKPKGRPKGKTKRAA